MTLWDWVLIPWGRPRIRAGCLRLQDEHGQCVSLILWRAWAHAKRRPIDAATINRAIALARSWDEGVLRPLRTARRSVPQPAGDLPGLIEAVELEAERTLLDGLEVLTPQPARSPPVESLDEALMAVVTAWGVQRPHVAELAAELGAC